MKLRRLPRDDDGESRYLHPHGYVIVQGRRTWSERVGAMRGQAIAGPMTWWDIYEHVGRTAEQAARRFHPWARRYRTRTDRATLREARQWCDEHPRDGWSAPSPVEPLDREQSE